MSEFTREQLEEARRKSNGASWARNGQRQRLDTLDHEARRMPPKFDASGKVITDPGIRNAPPKLGQTKSIGDILAEIALHGRGPIDVGNCRVEGCETRGWIKDADGTWLCVNHMHLRTNKPKPNPDARPITLPAIAPKPADKPRGTKIQWHVLIWNAPSSMLSYRDGAIKRNIRYWLDHPELIQEIIDRDFPVQGCEPPAASLPIPEDVQPVQAVILQFPQQVPTESVKPLAPAATVRKVVNPDWRYAFYVAHNGTPPTHLSESTEELLEAIALVRADSVKSRVDELLEAVEYAIADIDNDDAWLMPFGFELYGDLHQISLVDMASGKACVVAVALNPGETYRIVAKRDDLETLLKEQRRKIVEKEAA